MSLRYADIWQVFDARMRAHSANATSKRGRRGDIIKKRSSRVRRGHRVVARLQSCGTDWALQIAVGQ